MICFLCLETYFVKRSNFIQKHDLEKLLTIAPMDYLEIWFSTRRKINLQILKTFFKEKNYLNTWDIAWLTMSTGRTATEIKKWFILKRFCPKLTKEQKTLLRNNVEVKELSKHVADVWIEKQKMANWFLEKEHKNVVDEVLDGFTKAPMLKIKKDLAKTLNCKEKDINKFFKKRKNYVRFLVEQQKMRKL